MKHLNSWTATLAAASLFLGSLAMAAPTDAEIAEIMKTANDAEISAAKVAKSKSDNKDVKDFAKEMIEAHNDNLKEVKKADKSSNIKPKSNDIATSMEKDAKSKTADLKKKKGADFDKAYIDMQVSMHQQLLNDLDQTYIPAAQSPQLKEYLQNTRTHVEEHLTKAQNIQNSMVK